MRCPSCAQENPSEARFCNACGSALEASCPSCGQPSLPSSAFCNQCGAPLGDVSSPRTPTPQPAHGLPPSFASGRYQVQRFLGEGAKKRVYLAHDTMLDRDVALALIKADGLDAEGLARVHREAQAMGRLGDHPHIVTVYDVGDEAGQPYLIQEYMTGGDLEGQLQRSEGHRLGADEALRLAEQVCRALEHAHSRGVVHRDLKPGNIWLAQDGTAKLGDFGLAVALDRSRLTMAGMMVGTASYMPPEQALGSQATPRSDLYSLGCVLYEMATGRPPFLGDDAVAVISQHVNTAPVAPSWHTPDIPRALEALTVRLLAKAPDQRPEGAAAVADELRRIRDRSTPEPRLTEPSQFSAEVQAIDWGRFVGREQEMEQLKVALEGALSGRGSLAMLVGEPGIGKTRLADQFGVYSSLRGAQVLLGRCYEGDMALPYQPFVEAFRQYMRSRPDPVLRQELGAGAPEIAKLVSDVRQRFPDIPEAPPMEGEAERLRLFDSVTQFVHNAAMASPLVLVLDDIHWADKPSLLLLQYLARNVSGARVLLLCAYRDVELDRTHPLAEVMSTLRREQPYLRLLLRGLPGDAVYTLLTAMDPSEENEAGRQALAEALYQETEGNPFFIREVLSLLMEEGKLYREGGRWTARVTSISELGIPEGVREVIGRRLSRLSEGANRMLICASTMTGGLSWEELRAITGEDETALLDLLDEALGAQLIVERAGDQAGTYDFTHALIRQTLYGELSTPRRVILHRQIGQALEELHKGNVEPHLAELAHHFFQAAPGGDVDKAISYATKAGERSMAVVAYEEAAAHYERALQALELLATPDEPRRCELLLSLADAHNQGGDRDKGMQIALQAAAVARQCQLPHQLARAAFEYAFTWGEPGELNEEALALIREGVAALGDDDDALRARLMFRLGMELWLGGRPDDAGAPAEESLALARRAGDSEALAEALFLIHGLAYGPEVAQERIDDGQELVELAGAAGDSVAAIFGRYMRMRGLLELGDATGADVEAAQYGRLADELRRPQYVSWTFLFKAGQAARVGRFDEAEQLLRQGETVAERAQDQIALFVANAQLSVFWMHQGRIHDLEQGDWSMIEQNPLPAAKAYTAALKSFTGQEAEARRFFEELMHDDLAGTPREGTWPILVASLAIACAYLHDVQRAGTLYELLLPFTDRNVLDGSGAWDMGPAARYLGLLAVSMSRLDDAERWFEDAMTMNTKVGHRPWLTHAQCDHAELLAARDGPGDRTRAIELANEALDTGQALGMSGVVQRALALKVQLQGISSRDVRTSIGAVASSVGAERPDLRTHAAPDGTVTLLFTDIEGSTALNERLGDQRWMDVLRVHNAIVRGGIAAHGGYEVKSQGDGFMIAFGSARRALQCAIALQSAVAEHNGTADEPLRVRIGLHTGEPVREADDFYGRHVNLASRIADQAQGGEVLVSSLLKELTDSAGEFAFDDGREVELKGLTGQQRVFAVRWRSDA